MPQYIDCSVIVYFEKSKNSNNKTHVISHMVVMANIQALDRANTIEMEDGSQITIIILSFYNMYHQ